MLHNYLILISMLSIVSGAWLEIVAAGVHCATIISMTASKTTSLALPASAPVSQQTPLFSYRKFWAKRFGTAPFLPMLRTEMEELEWDSCDVIIVTGDAYVDHPSFGMAIIGRLLEAQGFRVGIISQPSWQQDCEAFRVLGKPNLFFGVTAGNMDSMVNNYTADRKIRTNDSYTPNGVPHKRPNRAAIVYAQRCREAYPEVPIVLGGIEASLRRFAHYDYWSDQVRRSILVDAKADILVYGNGERAIVEIAHRLARREEVKFLTNVRGTAVLLKTIPEEFSQDAVVVLPPFEKVKDDKFLYAQATYLQYRETNPNCARPLAQAHADRVVWVNPPPLPLTTEELDGVFDLPYSRLPHPAYGNAKIPAYEMIRFSVNILRGCFGGCTFCSITAHEGRVIQSRSAASILSEIEAIRDKTPGFTGIISDLGGPTANMYKLNCQKPAAAAVCRRLSCVYPSICKNMNVNHGPLIKLYRQARDLVGIKKVLIGSGVRYDLAVKAPEYVRELVTYHVGGYLKIAPEHISPAVLAKMMKPGIVVYDEFKKMFDKFSAAAGKEQYLIPYFIAAHPGATDADMLELALWLKANKYRLEQVQNFMPTPMTLATSMYYTEMLILSAVGFGASANSGPKGFSTGSNISKGEKIFIPRSGKTRSLHKAFLRYYDPDNWPLLREALQRMGHDDLIGPGKSCLVPKPSYYHGHTHRRRKF